ncbi:ankyrin repeat domain-containing protein [Fadolivirus algeromassiliense]|jgi:ankyrin repeat protein|uniref:Ankyrin repeat domain-containing protein n=1 Tax=Fadolivirus FV1/VV64 TaxID=3070911 RepID=A0A7D3QV53_9VIRU|nr:ankyrin repeat domain-containing protein [Fadolivirus algeromassiliense]QKF94004.1 ankyrin repeat domain-containing protein [Fadolivirus FV1/VV64]
MNFQKNLAVWKQLFALISVDEENQSEISNIFSSFKDKISLKEIINTPSPQKTGDETMLMWAVWRLKKQTVVELLDFGADPLFVNNVGESVATYWNFGISSDENNIDDTKQKLATEIIDILHKQKVNFSRGSYLSYGLTKRAKEYKLHIIEHKLRELGYY